VSQPLAGAHPAVGVAAPAAPAASRHPAGTDLIAPLVLLQLSDLHFGPHSRFVGCDLERLAAQCRQALDEARGDLGWREAVGLVLVTGDIAEAARPPEYATAATFFLALAHQLGLSPHRFVFVPGNHDISWTKCREIEGQLDDGAFPASELRARLDDVKLAHFEKFLRDVHGGKARHEVDGAAVTSLAHGVFVHDFADLGVSVAALNSCERESHRKEDHVGALSAAQAQAVLDHWRQAPAALIRLAAVHHNPASMASPAIDQWLGFLRTSSAQLTAEVVERIATNFVGFEGHEHLRHLAADAHTSLILHGHHHASTTHQAWAWRGRDPGGAGDARIVSAGSWGLSPESGKLPKDQPVVMQLIRLDRPPPSCRPCCSPTIRTHASPARFARAASCSTHRPGPIARLACRCRPRCAVASGPRACVLVRQQWQRSYHRSLARPRSPPW
jgi:3',5'-cyclic AMP phosphodiesterase CpdA